MSRLLRVLDFGECLVPYQTGLKAQQQLVEALRSTGGTDLLLQLQHPPVITLGKRGSTKDLKTPESQLLDLGMNVVHIPRGGEATLHSPGQLVMYPILSLHRLRYGARQYIEGLEDVIIKLCSKHGIAAQGRQKCRTGVWVGDQKIAAIGVRISGGYTCHGVALNVSNDLSLFSHIIPCGVSDRGVTSLSEQTEGLVSPLSVSEDLASIFADHFGYDSLQSVSDLNLPDPNS